jgi:DcmR-like sensory protein/uncharacterized protein DUF2188
MAHEQYYIVFNNEHWRVKHNGQLSAPYLTQAAAIEAAIEAAHRDGEYGNQAQVLVHGEDLLFSAVWTYGLDRYPPLQEIFDIVAHRSKGRMPIERTVNLAGAPVRCPCHVCALFKGAEEQYAVLVPFMRQGCAQGERSLQLLDKNERANRLSRLRESGIDVEAAQRTGQLHIEVWEDAYLRGGRFDADHMLEFVQVALDVGRQRGFARTRVWANMEWALTGAPGVDGLADYENRFNVLLARYGDAVVCAYDVTRFPSAIVEKVVRAHPYLLADGWGQENPYYVA